MVAVVAVVDCEEVFESFVDTVVVLVSVWRQGAPPVTVSVVVWVVGGWDDVTVTISVTMTVEGVPSTQVVFVVVIVCGVAVWVLVATTVLVVCSAVAEALGTPAVSSQG